MRSTLRYRICVLICSMAPAAAGGVAQAADFPNRQVRWIVPFAPGGPVDILSRAIAEKLSQRWGQVVVIDNRGGAGGSIGTDIVAKAAPDGYTLMTGHVGTHAINATLYRKLPYDPVRDFTPISMAAYMPLALVIHPSVPAKNVKELVALAKAQPGKLNYASAGIGGPTQLTAEVFKRTAGVDIVHVAYKGNTAALTDLITGEVQMMFSNLLTSMPHVRSGKLRAIGLSSARRSAYVPELRTIAESGLAGFDVTPWYGVLAPAGLPPPLLRKLNAEVAETLVLPDMQKRLVAQGIDLASNTPEQFSDLIKSELVRWRKIVRDSGAKPY